MNKRNRAIFQRNRDVPRRWKYCYQCALIAKNVIIKAERYNKRKRGKTCMYIVHKKYRPSRKKSKRKKGAKLSLTEKQERLGKHDSSAGWHADQDEITRLMPDLGAWQPGSTEGKKPVMASRNSIATFPGVKITNMGVLAVHRIKRTHFFFKKDS